MNRIVLTFIVAILIISGCDSKKTAKDDKQSDIKAKQMHFNIDTSAIGDTKNDDELMIIYNPPAEWNEASQEIREQMNTSVKKGLIDSSMAYDIRDVYLAENGCLFTVSMVEFADTIDNRLESYKKMILDKFKNENAKVDTFTKDDINITQFLIRNTQVVNFKLLFFNQNDDMIQLDYIVPKKIYEMELPSIESSIGSVKLTGNKTKRRPK